jgi:hypothetical protein
LHNNVAHIAQHDSVVIVPTFLLQALLGPEEAADQEMGVGCAEGTSGLTSFSDRSEQERVPLAVNCL